MYRWKASVWFWGPFNRSLPIILTDYTIFAIVELPASVDQGPAVGDIGRARTAHTITCIGSAKAMMSIP